jgi:hypothetical protein
MVKKRLQIIGADRLSTSRVEQLRKDKPERIGIAIGMRAPLPKGFAPNAKGTLTPLRPAYVEVHQAVDSA